MPLSKTCSLLIRIHRIHIRMVWAVLCAVTLRINQRNKTTTVMKAQSKTLVEKIESRIWIVLVTLSIAVVIFGFTHLHHKL
jgi:hypothetical protein